MYFEKSMRTANKKRTICEVVRECYDILVDFDDGCTMTIPVALNELSKRIKEIHEMAKRMTHKLYEYSKEWDAEFWAENPDYEEDLKRRIGYNNE